jgi:hypothetical protein
MREVMLTTSDNPYDPFEQFDEWFAFDTQKGYNTCAYLARIAKTSNELPDNMNDEETERAIDEICFFNVTGNYKKVVRES